MKLFYLINDKTTTSAPLPRNVVSDCESDLVGSALPYPWIPRVEEVYLIVVEILAFPFSVRYQVQSCPIHPWDTSESAAMASMMLTAAPLCSAPSRQSSFQGIAVRSKPALPRRALSLSKAVAEEKAAWKPPTLDPSTPSPIFGGSTGGLLRKAQVQKDTFYNLERSLQFWHTIKDNGILYIQSTTQRQPAPTGIQHDGHMHAHQGHFK